MDLSVLYQEIGTEMQRVDEELKNLVKMEDPLLTEASSHLLLAGGKRLRPAFVLLAGKFNHAPGEHLVPLAAAMELIHMASLVHDDVIDCSTTRRGVPTVKARWGNRVSMHTGDYLFAKALTIISRYTNERILRTLADVSVKMVEGEIQQILSAFDTRQTVKDYLNRIRRKTALLISTSFMLGAIASGVSETVTRSLTRYGYFIGMAFQITDDLLDFTSSEEVLGKAVGSDLTQGIITLPVIYALQSERGDAVRRLISCLERGEAVISEALLEVAGSGGLLKAEELKERYVIRARRELERLPPVAARQTLSGIADFINIRRF